MYTDDISDDEMALTSNTLSKEEREPPPQYHLETDYGSVKERLTRHTLQNYFGGHKLKDYGLLAGLGTGLKVIDNDNDIPTIGTLVNWKRGKHKQKGSRATVPLEVVGMDWVRS